MPDFNRAEVTIFFRDEDYRDFAGYNRKATVFQRMAKIKYDDGTESFCTVDIQLNDFGAGSLGLDVRPVFFMERNDVRDNHQGEVLHELKVDMGGDL